MTTSAERSIRFGYLISEIEMGARRILTEREDIQLALTQIDLHLGEARIIFDEISREALDKVTRDVDEVPPDGPWVGQVDR